MKDKAILEYIYYYFEPMNIHSKKWLLCILLSSTVLIAWCSQQTSYTNPASDSTAPGQAANSSATTKPTSDPLAGLTDTEKQFMQYYIDEWKQRLQNIWQGWSQVTNEYHRADSVGDYHVYTKLTSTNDTRRKVLVAVYTDQWVPVQSLQDLTSSGKRWNIVVDDVPYRPYMDAWFFFESEFKTDNIKSVDTITLEFMYWWEVTTYSLSAPQ